jgi:uncharacterized protein (TIGR02996 family)
MNSSSTGEILERAIVADPDDLAAHAAYADWLMQQGDPRGEFIQVQLGLEDSALPAEGRKQLQEREGKLLQEHGRKWLGGLADFLLDQKDIPNYLRQSDNKSGYFFGFARGWLDTLQAPYLPIDCADILAKAPETRLLRRLEIFQAESYEEPLPAIGSFLSNLRVLQIGEPQEGEYSNCHISGETAVDLVAKLPRLEELYLLAHRVDMERLFRLKTLDKLRVLQIYHCHRYPLELLADNASFANLTHLLFYPHAMEPGEEDDGAYINLNGVRAILQSRYLQKLSHLQFRLSDMGDDGCAEFVRSGILGRLKLLDLMFGRITDAGARTLAGCPQLKNLELLELSHNRLASAGINALQATGIKVQAGNQYAADGHDMEYLWMGDME